MRASHRLGRHVVGKAIALEICSMRWSIPLFVVGAVVLSGCGRPELREFSAPQDKFKILFPGTPISKKQNIPTGGQATTYAVEFRPGGYVVNSAPLPVLPGIGGKEVLKMSSEDAVKGMAGNIVSSKEVKSGNVDGLEVTASSNFEGKPATVRMRTFIVPGRLFQVMAVGKEASFVTSDEANKIFDSFQILP
jgi:hypothetical protein